MVRHFSYCNATDNHNMMWPSDEALEKYWANQSGYFRLATIVTLGMGLKDGKILFCNEVSEKINYNNLSMR